MLSERLMSDLVKLLDGPAASYGRGALVGVSGEMEQGGACVHPMLGKPMRAAIGSGGGDLLQREGRCGRSESRCPARAQGRLLVFPHFDTITVSVADAPPGRNPRCDGSL